MTIKEMRDLLGLSRAAFSRLYKIPIRTLEDWEAGRMRCPDYVLYFMERVVREDAKNPENLLSTAIDRQIEEMKTAKTEDEIISNRFL